METRLVIADFLKNRSALNRKPRTIQFYKDNLERFCCQYQVLPTDPSLIEDFLAFIHGTPETKHAYYRCLKALYRFAAKRYKVPNPINEIDRPLVPKKVPKTLDIPDLVKIYNHAADLRERVILSLFIDTGIRCGELNTLKKSDVFSDYICVDGKTGQRDVPVSEETLLLIRIICDQIDSEYVISDKHGHQLSTWAIYRIIRNIFRRSGMSGNKLGPHRLRHAFGKNYIKAGGDTRSLQKIMGHANITTTEKYIELSLSDISEKHNQFSPLKSILPQIDSSAQPVTGGCNG